MRISDWSSDVCSSDLVEMTWMLIPFEASVWNIDLAMPGWLRMPTPTTEIFETFGSATSSAKATSARSASSTWLARSSSALPTAIGRAACRERGCQDGSTSVVYVSLKKKHNTHI